jgi:NADH:quinone reductase (non-electrogenic)
LAKTVSAPVGPNPAAALAKAQATTAGARPRVVVVGAGFAGLACAKALRRAPVDVTLIDRQNHHCFQPLLYQVATAELAPDDVAWPVRSILQRQNNAVTLMSEVVGILPSRKQVICAHGPVSYDFLVVATGATHSYFGHPEWSRFAPGLKNIEDATHIRDSILRTFERAELAAEEKERTRLQTFVVVGGGPTGVELAGAIAETAKRTMSKDFRRSDPRRARIILVEASERILSSFPNHLSHYAEDALANLGVEVRTNLKVLSCDGAGVETSAGRLDAGAVIWAAGVAASPVASWLGVAQDRSGRCIVEQDLTVPSDPTIFVVGDTAAVSGEDGKLVPGIAPAAKQMGAFAAQVIKDRAEGSSPPRRFRYRHAGDLATIGRNNAIIRRGRFELTGFLGWMAWSVVHIYFLIGARSRIAVAFNWFWDYLSSQRKVRLIIGEGPDPSGASLQRRNVL